MEKQRNQADIKSVIDGYHKIIKTLQDEVSKMGLELM